MVRKRKIEDDKHSAKYFLRPKRPRLQHTDECFIVHLPTEILTKIFNYFTYDEIAQDLRLVNRKFRIISEHILNSHFRIFERSLEALENSITESISTAQDKREARNICKLLNVTEYLKLYHSVIMSSIWRYVYQNPNPRLFSFCMYGGQILDAFVDLIRQIKRDPVKLCQIVHVHGYRSQPESLENLAALVKVFCTHFDSICEQGINTPSKSGCKVLDILDCATFCNATIYSENAIGNNYCLKASYYFTNSWFVALDLPDGNSFTWDERQKFMYMRLRRIVLAHTEMNMVENQYLREIALAHSASNRLEILKPSCSVYTGYGYNSDILFFYGTMNDGAYEKKFLNNFGNQDIWDNLDDDEFSDEDPSDGDGIDEVNSEVTVYSVPPLGFQIHVNVKCPLHCAPWRFLKDRDIVEWKNRKGKIQMEMEFHCHGAAYPRLPEKYKFVVEGS